MAARRSLAAEQAAHDRTRGELATAREELATLQAILRRGPSDLEAWRAQAQQHAAKAKTREEQLCKQLEATLFEAGHEAQSRAKTLDDAVAEAQKRASDL